MVLLICSTKYDTNCIVSFTYLEKGSAMIIFQSILATIKASYICKLNLPKSMKHTVRTINITMFVGQYSY
jgi:hypothetical protein